MKQWCPLYVFLYSYSLDDNHDFSWIILTQNIREVLKSVSSEWTQCDTEQLALTLD